MMQPAPPPKGGITDIVFAGERGGRDARLAACALAVLILYGGALGLSEVLGAPVANWSAEMAARIHDEIARERAVDLSPPPPPAPPPQVEPPPPPPAAVRAPRPVRATAARAAAPSPPAQAGKLTAVANAPVDLTGAAFVVGGAATFPGGVTAAQGTGVKPGTAAAMPNAAADRARAPSRARPVSLDQAAWSCPWPAEADAEQVNEKTVVLRVRVRADGHADAVDVLSDPGFGFGVAARGCALATRFEPARDADGRPTTALSAPIRVHFYR
jgi:protein TonB